MRSMTLLFLLLLGAGCGEPGPGRVSFALEVAGGSAKELSNDHGYQVSLSRAILHISAVHFFSGDPLFTRRPGLRQRIGQLLMGVAHAHPGHYQEGDAMAELLSPATVDLLGGPTSMGRAAGVAGAYRSAQVSLAEVSSGGETYLARVGGEATRGGQKVRFTGVLTGSLKIAGVAASATVDQEVAAARMTVDLGRWVERIDFSALPHCTPGAACAAQSLKPGTQAHNALQRGVNNTSGFSFSWRKQ